MKPTALNAYIRKEEMSQINNLSAHEKTRSRNPKQEEEEII